MKAYVFPGQGSQFTGMGKDLYDNRPKARELMDAANDILGFGLTKIMFEGSTDELKQTRVTQPAIFVHSVATALSADTFAPDMVAGHSLGEFSALVANGVLNFNDALKLVSKRAEAMQKACEQTPSVMAAILGMADEKVEEICASITDEIVVAANYNCPGQVVISGSIRGIEIACEKMKTAGAKRAVVLEVSGAFHSSFMAPAREELAAAISNTNFGVAKCPIYQNVNAQPVTDTNQIRKNLIDQLTAPVRWTQSIKAMYQDGAREFIECGPGKVLQGLVRKIEPDAAISTLQV
jgi:[acyl-carrier-protein] S-malonyltransferase